MTIPHRIGAVLVAAGLVALAVVGLLTLRDLDGGTLPVCAELDGSSGAPNCVVSASRLRLLLPPGAILRLNGKVALGVAGVVASSDERAAADAAIMLRTDAKAAVDKSELVAAIAAANLAAADVSGRGKAAAEWQDAEDRLAARRTRQAAIPPLSLAVLPTHKLALFIDGVRTPVTFDVDERAAVQTRVVTLTAPDNATDSDASAWRRLIGGFPISGLKAVKLGIGDPGTALPFAGAEVPTTLLIHRLPLVIVGAVALLAIAGGLCTAAWSSGMLRDPPVATPLLDGSRPFSLARVQMLCWLFLIIGGFIFIWLVAGAFDGVVNASALTLLGIQGTTALAALLIGQSTGAATTAPKSRGFWADITSTREGPQLQRIQLIAWTIILAAVFLWSVLFRVSFPDFDNNLLLTAGIANGLYLGFKWPEASK